VPNPSEIKGMERALLVKAFRERDRALATEMALEIYQIKPSEMERMLEH
jgi:hypothetical protein